MKYNLEKMMKHISLLGTKISTQAKKVQDQTSFISSETDLKLFINENRSVTDIPLEVNVENLNLADEYQSYQNELLAEKQKEEALKAKEEEEARKEIQMEFQNLEPPERVRRMLYNLIIECIPFTDEEVKFVKDCLQYMEVRQQLSEFLQAFTSPRCVVNEECL